MTRTDGCRGVERMHEEIVGGVNLCHLSFVRQGREGSMGGIGKQLDWLRKFRVKGDTGRGGSRGVERV